MACVTGCRDQPLRSGNMEGVRFDLEIVGNAGSGNLNRIEQLVKNAFRPFLTDGMTVYISFIDGKPVSVELPQQVVCTVVETEPVVKGQTASSSYKPSILDNGVRVMVPPFINAGDKIVVSPSEGTYVERAK